MRFPKKGQLVLATVREVRSYGAICLLTEFQNHEAFLPLSEVATRWIKNIHEFLHPNQKLIVKVIRADKTRGVIDVSLKRVSEREKKRKIEEVERRTKAIKLLAAAAKRAGSRIKPQRYVDRLIKEGKDPFDFLERAKEDPSLLDEWGLPDKVKGALSDILQSLTPPPVVLKAELKAWSLLPDGVEEIKKRLSNPPEDVHIHYIKAGHYLITGKDEDEDRARDKIREVFKRFKDYDGHVEWDWIRGE